MSVNTNKKQVAVVTGALSGIGLGITLALLKHDYCAVANSRTIRSVLARALLFSVM